MANNDYTKKCSCQIHQSCDICQPVGLPRTYVSLDCNQFRAERLHSEIMQLETEFSIYKKEAKKIIDGLQNQLDIMQTTILTQAFGLDHLRDIFKKHMDMSANEKMASKECSPS